MDKLKNEDLKKEMYSVFSELDIESQEHLISLAQTARYVEQVTKQKYEQPKQTA